MWTKITLALALALAVSYAVPASAGPTTCGHATMQYDSSGTWTGPYLRLALKHDPEKLQTFRIWIMRSKNAWSEIIIQSAAISLQALQASCTICCASLTSICRCRSSRKLSA